MPTQKATGNNFPSTPCTGDLLVTALNAMDDIVVVLNKDFRYTFINAVGWEVLDFQKTEVLGESIWDLFPSLKKSEFKTSASQAMERQIKIEIEEYYPRVEKWYRTKFYPSNSLLMVQMTDISDLKRAQEINSQLMGDLQQAMEVYWSEENRTLREAKQLKQ